jgi:hypothetical protein
MEPFNNDFVLNNNERPQHQQEQEPISAIRPLDAPSDAILLYRYRNPPSRTRIFPDGIPLQLMIDVGYFHELRRQLNGIVYHWTGRNTPDTHINGVFVDPYCIGYIIQRQNERPQYIPVL